MTRFVARLLPALFPLLLFQALAQNQDLKLRIPPVRTSLQVDGQTVGITAWGEVAPVSPDIFHLELTADLGDVQANLTALLGSQLNRSDRCGERLSVERASLLPAPPSGLLKASFHYERWACAKVLGREVAKRLAGGNGVLEVLLTPVVRTNGISLTSEVRKIDADGSLGELLRSGSLGASVKKKLAASIQSAIQKAADFPTILPSVVETAVTIRSLQFAEGEDRLLLSLAADVRITPDQWQALTKQFGRH